MGCKTQMNLRMNRNSQKGMMTEKQRWKFADVSERGPYIKDEMNSKLQGIAKVNKMKIILQSMWRKELLVSQFWDSVRSHQE